MAFLWVRSSPAFASLSICSLSSMLTCALTLYNVIGWERFFQYMHIANQIILKTCQGKLETHDGT